MRTIDLAVNVSKLLPDAEIVEGPDGELLIRTGLRQDGDDAMQLVPLTQHELQPRNIPDANSPASVIPNSDDHSFASIIGLVVQLGEAERHTVARILASYRWALAKNAGATQKTCAESKSE